MPYFLLALTIALEVVATSALKATEGFTRPIPSAIVIFGYAASFYLMTIVLKSLPLGVVYATWSGLGTVGVAVLGILLYRDPVSIWTIPGMLLVIGGVTILNLAGGAR